MSFEKLTSEEIFGSEKTIRVLSWVTIIWCVFTIALAIWWWILGMRMNDLIFGSNNAITEALLRHRHMLNTEGFVLITLIFSGGLGLVISLRYVGDQTKRLREFFAVFTHELKTSLTKLRLQTELLQAERAGLPLQRLLEESVGLEIQLENSLWLARGTEKVYLENLDLKKELEIFSLGWPSLKIQVDKPVWLRCDRRVLESVLRNLFQNAKIHGEATEVFLLAEEVTNGVNLRVKNNGKPFHGNILHIGKIFASQGTTGKSGVGLYLVKTLMRRMNGTAEFLLEGNQLIVDLRFREGP